MIKIFEFVDKVTITYINTNLHGKLYAEFRVQGLYREKELNNSVIVTLKDLVQNKLINSQPNASTYDFLVAIKKIKSNLHQSSMKKMLAKIAYEQKLQHEKEMEELILMLELVNTPKKVKKNNNNVVGYNRNGEYVYGHKKI